jgi:hypothetical protein
MVHLADLNNKNQEIKSCSKTTYIDDSLSILHLHDVNDEMIEDQNDINLLFNDLKQPTPDLSSFNGPFEPCIGLEFDVVKDACACYNAYARQKGFSIRKSHTRPSKEDKSLIVIDYACSREGFHSKIYQNLKRAETKIGCKAMMS